MDVAGLLKVILLVVPLGLDTLGLGTALGSSGISGRGRMRISLIFMTFEAVMPLVGFGLGRALGSAVGHVSTYVAAAVLLAVAVYMVWPRADEDEADRMRLVEHGRGLGVLALALSVSMDELAIGFGIGLVRLPIAVLIVLIAAQAFVGAQLGMRLGSRLGNEVGEWAERLAALVLLGATVLIVTT